MPMLSTFLSVEAVSQFVIGALFLIAASSKLIAFKWFAETLASYRLLPSRLTNFFAALVVLAEAVSGILLLAGALMPWAAYAATALLLCFTTSIAINLAKGRFSIECGCFSLWKKSKVGWLLLFRNLGLLGLALLSTWPRHESPTLIPGGLFIAFLALSVIPLFYRGKRCGD